MIDKKRSKNWFRFSIRGLLILVTLVAFAAIVMGQNSGRVKRQQRQIDKLQRKGYRVSVATFAEARESVPSTWLPTWDNESPSELICHMTVMGDFETLEELCLTEFGSIKELHLLSDSLNSIEGLQSFSTLETFEFSSNELTECDLGPLANSNIERLSLDCSKIGTFEFLDSMPHLKVLILGLKELRVAKFEKATQLRDLRFIDCEQLHSINGLPDSLKYLSVRDCPMLVAIEGLDLLPKFEDMTIKDCPELKGEQLEKIKAIFRNHTVEENENVGYWGYK